MLRFYSPRLRIEDWNRILTSGCDVKKIARSRTERF